MAMISAGLALNRKRSLVEIERGIHLIRGQRVMLDSDLAAVYGVTTTRLNEQLRRNIKRFPADFAFRLTRGEFANLISQIATSSLHGGRRKVPWAFTEHGALMLASVLNSDVAIEASVRVVRAFVTLREMISANVELSHRLKELEGRMDKNDEAIAQLFAAIRSLLTPPERTTKREIGFHVRERQSRYRVTKIRRR